MSQENWNREQEETGCRQPAGPVLCANNCGFFGSATTMNLCSKCYGDIVLEKADAAVGERSMVSLFGENGLYAANQEGKAISAADAAVRDRSIKSLFGENGLFPASWEGDICFGDEADTVPPLSDFFPIQESKSPVASEASSSVPVEQGGAPSLMIFSEFFRKQEMKHPAASEASSSIPFEEGGASPAMNFSEFFRKQEMNPPFTSSEVSFDLPFEQGLLPPVPQIPEFFRQREVKPLLASEDSSSVPFEQGGASLVGTLQQNQQTAQTPNRCFACRKRVGLTGFKCRCGDIFCALHRYSDKHNCTFDYKAVARDAIAKANPVVKAVKIEKI